MGRQDPVSGMTRPPGTAAPFACPRPGRRLGGDTAGPPGYEKESAALNKRAGELDAIFRRLYGDSVPGRVAAERFQALSAGCMGEMARIQEKIPAGEATIRATREKVRGTDHFIALAKRYTDIREPPPEPPRLFIRKIVVHERDVKWSKHARQTVEIHYNDIGYMGVTPDEARSMTESA